MHVIGVFVMHGEGEAREGNVWGRGVPEGYCIWPARLSQYVLHGL